ncbi:DUF1836 domain-containing protein [Lactiplantibacillus garii]|uniref:DUF1836 domain-containing protein n=1 Tax=Lactiplantibacillus garii TaxID=2306423 RepID=A0A426D829_9LACO|nr:DUF1836 domain-containing protein [Lactiplantibacillus garii]RRK10740.1 DUF1836 domain-containing protein [Lactiplantibacillus garii]
MIDKPLTTFELVRWDDLPTMPIYMEQLLQLVNQMLTPLGLPAVTKTMVNSYVKQHFFSRPTGRRYTRNHVVAVLVVSILKADFALPVISRAILNIRDSRQVAVRYAQFSQAFEGTLREVPLAAPSDAMERAIQYAACTVAYHLLTVQTLG